MPRITLTRPAVEKLLDDREFRHRQFGVINDRVTVLWYYQRSYATSPDGVVTEYGDGFSLTTIAPADLEKAGIEFAAVTVCGGFEVLVGADASMMAADFTIGWSKRTFTYEPRTPS